jgi:glutamate-ammonia-ligase adenylyltransferase
MSSVSSSDLPGIDVDHLLSLPPDEAGARLRALGFRDGAAALQNLRRLASGSPLSPLPRALLAEVCASPDPDTALNQFERVAASAISRPSFYATLDDRPEVCHELTRLLSVSPFLADILVRNPTFFHYLFETPGLLTEEVPPERLLADLRRGIGVFRTQETRLNALRRLVRRELLRLGASDLTGETDILTVARGLSDLADAVLQILIDLLRPPLVSRHGVPRDGAGREVGFAVIALGKLGGRELNFSSDVDLMFVYGADGETDPASADAGPVSNQEFFNRLAGEIARHAAEVTDEGFLYRVDLRLRPDGEAGALARSVASYERYYESRGEVWERQMLIKARACAGDRETGEAFLGMIEPFVYPAYVDFSPAEEVRRIKEKIEAKLGRRGQRETHLKLRPGGIRDVEFIVQALQLLMGRQQSDVRAGATAKAIAALRRAGGLSEAEAADLEAAYRFFRRLEHRLQMRQNRSAYVLPEAVEDLRPVALSLGYPDAPALRRELDGHLARVRAIYEDLFRPAPPSPRLDAAALCEREPGDAEASACLRSLGFEQPEGVHRNLIFLAYGHFPRLRGARTKGRFLDLAPRLLDAARRRSDPDAALNRFERVVTAYGAAEALYRLLSESPGLLDLILALCAESGFLAEMISREPALLDWLTVPDVLLRDRTGAEMEAEFSAALSDVAGEDEAVAALNALKNRETLRIGARDILGLADVTTTLDQLALLAETVLRRAHALSERRLVARWGTPGTADGAPARCAVIGLGKLGGREMDFGSDLDLVFVYSDDGETTGGPQGERTENLRFFIDLAQETLNLLSHPTPHGLLYRVDARLRPEGGSALLALSLAAYARYLRERAATWERLALCRARLVAGDETFGRQVLDRIEAFVAGDGLSEAQIAEIARMRGRMEQGGREKYPGQVHLKTGRGGVVDVEFIAQTLQIAGRSPDLRAPGTLKALRRLRARGLLTEPDFRALTDAYRFLRAVEKALRRADDRARNVLPEDPHALQVLARSVGFAEAEAFLETLRAHTESNRAIFERLVGKVR